MPPSDLEKRLQRRAEGLGATPLVPEALAAELRASMGLQVRAQSLLERRRQWSFSLLGFAAAVLLLFLVPKPPAGFGSAPALVAFLDPAGRVLQDLPGQRSASGQIVGVHEEFLLEVVAQEDLFFAVRIGRDGQWQDPLGPPMVGLSSGAEWIMPLLWPQESSAVLLIFSKRAIPGELLDAHLARATTAQLEREFGCHIELRELSGRGRGL